MVILPQEVFLCLFLFGFHLGGHFTRLSFFVLYGGSVYDDAEIFFYGAVPDPQHGIGEEEKGDGDDDDHPDQEHLHEFSE